MKNFQYTKRESVITKTSENKAMADNYDIQIV